LKQIPKSKQGYDALLHCWIPTTTSWPSQLRNLWKIKFTWGKHACNYKRIEMRVFASLCDQWHCKQWEQWEQCNLPKNAKKIFVCPVDKFFMLNLWSSIFVARRVNLA
jgi:hypothetical protein